MHHARYTVDNRRSLLVRGFSERTRLKSLIVNRLLDIKYCTFQSSSHENTTYSHSHANAIALGFVSRLTNQTKHSFPIPEEFIEQCQKWLIAFCQLIHLSIQIVRCEHMLFAMLLVVVRGRRGYLGLLQKCDQESESGDVHYNCYDEMNGLNCE